MEERAIANGNIDGAIVIPVVVVVVPISVVREVHAVGAVAKSSGV
jgi:hypothetical protein